MCWTSSRLRAPATALCAALLLAALGSTAAAGSCSLTLAAGQEPQSFTGCTLLSRVGNQFFLLWKTEEVAADPSKWLLTIAMNASLPAGYVSVGFPSRAGSMTDSTAMILQTCEAGTAGCTGGAKLMQWYLAGEKQSDVNPDNRVAITGIQAGIPAPGLISGSFQIEVPAAGRRRLQQLNLAASGDVNLIFAAGNLFSDGTPRQHYSDGFGALPILAAPAPPPAADGSTGGSASGDTTTSGSASGDSAGSGSEGSTSGGSIDFEIEVDDDSTLKAAHAWLGAIGWGVLVPSGIVMARSFKDTMPPMWFHMHRVLLALGFVMGTICLGLGFDLNEGWETNAHDNTIHRDLGMACTVLGATQFTAIAVRPAKGHKFRAAWELWHHWVGRAAAVIAIANIYWGCLYIWDLGVWAWASYTAVLAVIVATSLVKDGTDYLKARKAGSDVDGQGQLMTDVEQAEAHKFGQDENGKADHNGSLTN